MTHSNDTSDVKDMTGKTEKAPDGNNMTQSGGCGASCGCSGQARARTAAQTQEDVVDAFLHSQRNSQHMGGLTPPYGMAERILARAAREPRNVYAPLRNRGVWARVLQAGRDAFTPDVSRGSGFGSAWARPAFAFVIVAVMMMAVFFAPDAHYSGLSAPTEHRPASQELANMPTDLFSSEDRNLALEVLTEGDLELFELAYAKAEAAPVDFRADFRGDLDDLILQDMEDVFL